MNTLNDRWDKLVTRFKEITAFRRVEKIPIQRLIDDSFWTGLTGLSIPAAYIVLKTDEEDGRSARSESVWAVLIVANTKPTKPTEDVLALIELCRAKLDYQWSGTYYHLLPKNKLTFLQALPQIATVELEINTVDSD